MPEQRENSVLFSLKELRRIEDDRIRQEEADARARVESERKAREDAERKARDEIDRRRRDEEDRVRRTEEDKVAREREEQMRLQETERRARVEAEMRIQEERMRLEVQAKKAKSPLPAILVVGGILIIAAGIAVYKVNSQAEAEKIALQRQAAEEAERIKKESDDRTRRLEGQIAQKEKEMREAKTEEERVRLRAEKEALQNRRGSARPRAQAADPTPAAPKQPRIREKRQINDDPLEGLKL
jgi:colicin import membrane protein